jgi:hypothetical protein
MSERRDPPPGHPFTPGQVKMLRRAVIIMGVLLVAGIAALIYGFVREARKMTSRAEISIPATPFSSTIAAGDGKIRALTLADGVLAIAAGGKSSAVSGDEIVLFDIRARREIGRLKLKPAE